VVANQEYKLLYFADLIIYVEHGTNKYMRCTHCTHPLLGPPVIKVVFHSRMDFFSFSWTEIVFAPLHKPSSNNINYALISSEKWCTSLKKDISKSKRPGLIQPTMMMLCRKPQKQ